MLFALIDAGNYRQVEEHVATFRRSPGDSPSYWAGSAETISALSVIRQGRLRRGLDALIPAIEQLRIGDPEILLPYALGLAAYAAARLGERTHAVKYAAQFRRLPSQGPRHRWLVAAAHACAAKAPKNGADAPAELADLAAQARGDGLFRAEKEILEVLCRYGAPDHLHRLGELAASFEGTEAGVGYQVAAAQAAQDPDRLLAAALTAENALRHLEAAECLAAAVPIYARAGDDRQSGVVRHRLKRLLHEAGDIATPALVDAAEGVGLTQREQEIVALAAEGLSNGEIAKQLFVSQRTVEGHLYRAFSKLGISQRQELGRVTSQVLGQTP
jgi:DNA-binding NarL/FixJ family response regulator